MPGGARALTLSQALSRLDGQILVACDFDGTLARIVDDPSEARPDARALAALVLLAERSRTSVAVISGRSRDDLKQLIGSAPGVLLVGEHGSDAGAGPVGDPGLIRKLSEQLQEIAADYPGAAVEQKRLSVAFHYRNAGDDIEEAVSRVREVSGHFSGVVVSQGKKVVEIHATTRNKGDAVDELRRSTTASVVVFLGDDVTDETVFQRLQPQDVGIKVGEGESAARYRVADVPGVADVLEELGSLPD